jgi:hypothetical protein
MATVKNAQCVTTFKKLIETKKEENRRYLKEWQISEYNTLINAIDLL